MHGIGVRGTNNFDHLHLSDGIEEVDADQAATFLHARSNFIERDARRISRDQRAGLGSFFDLLKQAAFRIEIFDYCLDNDVRLGSGPGAQVRIVLDIIQEYQVLASQYSAEYGGAAGVVINMVTKSGTNDFSGRAYSYWRKDWMYARREFLEPAAPKPEESTLQAGFGVGGPIIRDRMHFYFNYERDDEEICGFKNFPNEGFPIAQNFTGCFEVPANNYFARGDFQVNPNNVLSLLVSSAEPCRP